MPLLLRTILVFPTAFSRKAPQLRHVVLTPKFIPFIFLGCKSQLSYSHLLDLLTALGSPPHMLALRFGRHRKHEYTLPQSFLSYIVAVLPPKLKYISRFQGLESTTYMIDMKDGEIALFSTSSPPFRARSCRLDAAECSRPHGDRN
ncbi:hypothetical protein C8J57DRAFT_1364585, partial [Mycena rebaudengoi]